jgi:sulfur transfer protein SufE
MAKATLSGQHCTIACAERLNKFDHWRSRLGKLLRAGKSRKALPPERKQAASPSAQLRIKTGLGLVSFPELAG